MPTLVNGGPNRGGDDIANGTVVDPALYVFGECRLPGTSGQDDFSGDILSNPIRGRTEKDFLCGGLRRH